jgi:NAD(P)-dependent dehydrogenase (short-subunit alcohol dehydrogenase family)
MTLPSQRAIVVGASSGIGAEIARQLCTAGGRVALLGRRGSELQNVAAGHADKARTFVHDVQDFEAIPALFDTCVAELGGLDLIVYAAGVMPAIAESEYDFAKDRQMIEVNLLGAMAWFNLAAAHFEAQRAGKIIGISSIAGERGRRGNPAYCTSKAALTSYLEGLRNRLGRYGSTQLPAAANRMRWATPRASSCTRCRNGSCVDARTGRRMRERQRSSVQ